MTGAKAPPLFTPFAQFLWHLGCDWSNRGGRDRIKAVYLSDGEPSRSEKLVEDWSHYIAPTSIDGSSVKSGHKHHSAENLASLTSNDPELWFPLLTLEPPRLGGV
jgi:hypothetical protein